MPCHTLVKSSNGESGAGCVAQRQTLMILLILVLGGCYAFLLIMELEAAGFAFRYLSGAKSLW